MAMIPSSSTNNGRLQEKLECLRGMMQQLKSKAHDIQNEVRNEELQARKKRKGEVALWLQQVSGIEEQVQSIGTEVAQVGFFGRGQLSKKLEEMMDDIEQLLKRSEFPRGLLLDDVKHEGLQLLAQKMEGSTPSRVEDEVWSCFERGESRVGVFGIGGVGKTSLAMNINNQILKQKRLFGRVYYVTVSRETSVLKLQSDIAKAFDLRLNYEDEPKRAAELRMGLTKREKCLLILDDVWEDITMKEVGVLVEGDGCKLFITTRKRDVCCRMDCFPVKMEPLLPEESWDLFRKEIGNFETLADEVKAIAHLVAKECDGLPLGIVTMARSMRGVTSVHGWRNALNKLWNPCNSPHDMKNKVFRILRYSYDHLYDTKHQKCFLYCALYPEDYEIERNGLIRQLIGAGLLDGTNRNENIDEGHTLLDHLENASMLECVIEWEGERHVKMHDLVRDMAIGIIGSTGMLKGGMDLKEIPGKEEWNNKDWEWVSLMENSIDRIEGMMPDCPNISVLLLQGNCLLRSVSDSFFVQMIGLKFLDLSDTDVKELPGSISNFFNLNALLLSGCGKLDYIPSLEKLTKLRELDISGCGEMRTLPEGMDKLASLEHLNLRYIGIEGLYEGIASNSFFERMIGLNVLDLSGTGVKKLPGSIFGMFNLNALLLSGCGMLDYIPSLAKLTKLRELDISGCGEMRTLPEGMEKLASLEHLNLQYSGIEGVYEGIFINLLNLESFLCKHGIYFPPEEVISLVHLKKLNGVHFEDVSVFNRFVGCVKLLITYLVTLQRKGFQRNGLSTEWETKEEKANEDRRLVVRGVEECFLVPQNVGALMLRKCSFGVGSLLEALPSLADVTDLQCCELQDCKGIKYIIPEGWNNKTLEGIGNLELRCLDEFGGLIREQGVHPFISFSGLRKLEIIGCQKLKKLWMLNLDLPNLEQIFISACYQMEEIFATEKGGTVRLSKLHYLEVINSPAMKNIGMVSCSMPSLETIEIKHCIEMEEIFAVEDEAGDEEIHLPKLNTLGLSNVPELRSISRQTIVCNSLQLVSIDGRYGVKMENCPISLPTRLSVITNNEPLPVFKASGLPRDWWDSLRWNDPATHSLLNQTGCFRYCDPNPC